MSDDKRLGWNYLTRLERNAREGIAVSAGDVVAMIAEIRTARATAALATPGVIMGLSRAVKVASMLQEQAPYMEPDEIADLMRAAAWINEQGVDEAKLDFVATGPDSSIRWVKPR